jgi:Uri superfamily endonuclease
MYCFRIRQLRFSSADAPTAPSAPGAYILEIDLAQAAMVTIARQPPQALAPGHYLYCGSANGPGGLKSRLARHMRKGKSVHWHIDQLTERGA